MLRRRPSPAFVLAFIALVVSTSGVGIAAIPSRDGDIHICYSKKTGAVEVVDTPSDDFDCDKNWSGFIVDTKPTQLVSPSGKFKVEATDTGARLIGPDATVEVGAGTVNVRGTKGIDVRSNSVVDVTSGNPLTLTSAKGIDLKSADDLNLTAGKRLVGVGDSAALTGKDSVGITSGKTLEVTGGSNVELTGGRDTTVQSGGDLALLGGKNGRLAVDDALAIVSGKATTVDAGKNLELDAGELFDFQAKKLTSNVSTSMLLKSKDITIQGSGKIDMKATGVVNIKGSKVNEN